MMCCIYVKESCVDVKSQEAFKSVLKRPLFHIHTAISCKPCIRSGPINSFDTSENQITEVGAMGPFGCLARRCKSEAR